jgi:hypothetical protein
MEMQPTVMTIFVLGIMWGVTPEAGDIPNAYPRAQVEDWLKVHLYLPKGTKLTSEELNKLGVQNEKQVTLKLKKSLYGLKQAGRLWNDMLNEFLVNKLSFQRCKTDRCMYVKVVGPDIIVVGIYVDDILATGTRKQVVDDFFEDAKQMEIKYLGKVNKFLGIRVSQDEDGGMWLDQEATIEEMLIKFKLQDANHVRLPIGADYEENQGSQEKLPKYSKDGEVTVRDFQSLAGSLLWVARCTRPDILFAVHCITRKTHAPTVQDYQVAKKILRYLKGSKMDKLKLPKWNGTGKVSVEAYSDADWADNKSDRKSVSGGLVLLNGIPVSWSCKKQTCVALSTLEAEYIAASEVCKTLIGMEQLLSEIGLQIITPIPLWMDNQAAIINIQQESSSSRLKHVDTRIKFLCDRANQMQVSPKYVKSEHMIADMFTKPLPQQRLYELKKMIGIEGENECKKLVKES